MSQRDDERVDKAPPADSQPYPKALAALTYAWYRGSAAVAANVFRGSMGRRVVDAIGLTTGVALSGKRQMVARHHRRILGPHASESAVQTSVSGAFRSYARYWHEMSRLGDMLRSGEILRTTRVEGFHHIEESAAAGNGTIVVLPHLGGFDAAGAWLALKGYPPAVVAEVVEPRSVFDWFIRIRTAIGMKVIPLGPAAAGEVARELRANRVVCLLSDRDIAGDGIPVRFFDGMASMPGGPAVLALRTGARILPAAAFFDGPSGHRIEVRPPLDLTRSGSVREDVMRITQSMAECFEEFIREAPDQWLVMLPFWEGDE